MSNERLWVRHRRAGEDMIDLIPALGLRSWISKVGILETQMERGRWKKLRRSKEAGEESDINMRKAVMLSLSRSGTYVLRAYLGRKSTCLLCSMLP
jgi:hypothetical protein